MRVMVMIKATRRSEEGVLPSEELLAQMAEFNEALAKAGVLLVGEGLHPSSEGKRVVFSGRKRTVSDGPFAEMEGLLAGFWLWRVESMAEAVEWLKRCPNPMPGEEVEIEIRPLYESDELVASDPTGKIRKKERRLRKIVELRRV